jgi:hypothetical protein
MRYVVTTLAALLLSGQALAQDCAGEILGAVPRDAATLTWQAPTHWTNGEAIGSSQTVLFVVYEVVDGQPVRRCRTSARTASFFALSDGAHTWRVATFIQQGDTPFMSELSTPWSKTVEPSVVVPPPPSVALRPNPPTGLTGR